MSSRLPYYVLHRSRWKNTIKVRRICNIAFGGAGVDVCVPNFILGIGIVVVIILLLIVMGIVF